MFCFSFYLWSAHVASLIELFHLSNLLQISIAHSVVDGEFFGNFSFSCKRISLDDGSQLVIVNFWWPATMFFILKSLVSFANLPELHCTVSSAAVSGPNALLMYVVSTALWLVWTWIRKLLKFVLCLTSFPQFKINIKYTASNKSWTRK